MWCPDCQQQVAVRLKPGENTVRCARCGAKYTSPARTRRQDSAASNVRPPVDLQLAAVASGQPRKAGARPFSETSSWMFHEDLTHIGRVARGALDASPSAAWLDDLLQGRITAAETTEAPDAARSKECAAPAAACPAANLAASDQAEVHAVRPTADPPADAAPTARKPSRLTLPLAEIAGMLGALSLLNGLGLAAWSRFGGRSELLSLGLPVLGVGVGLLFVSRLLHGKIVYDF